MRNLLFTALHSSETASSSRSLLGKFSSAGLQLLFLSALHDHGTKFAENIQLAIVKVIRLHYLLVNAPCRYDAPLAVILT